MNNLKVKSRLRSYYYKKHIIKEENIPDSYYLNQLQILEDRGEEVPELTKEFKKEHALIIINGQKESLNRWFDYFLSSDSSSFPIWAKYWAFEAVTRMGKPQMMTVKGKQEKVFTFTKRTKDQVAPFPEINREVLAKVVGAFIRNVKNEPHENIGDEEFLKLAQKANFSKMYAYQLYQFKQSFIDPNKNKETRGKWRKFEKGSDPYALVKSLEEKNTGWCNAETENAKKHLRGGDFYVYFTLDHNNNATIPRIGIRMSGDYISEVRGVGNDQNLDSVMASSDILINKLKEFGPEGESYLKRVVHMKRLSEIYARYKNDKTLNEEDIRFLYEIDEPIERFGYEQDKRVGIILKGRSLKESLSELLDIPANEISTVENEAVSGNFSFHYGDLNLWFTYDMPSDIELPRIIDGNLNFWPLKKMPEDFQLPETIRGDLNIRSIESLPDGYKITSNIEGSIYLNSLNELPAGFKLSDIVNGNLSMDSLEKAPAEFQFPRIVRGSLILSSLKYIPEGFKRIESIEEVLDIRSVKKIPAWFNVPKDVKKVILSKRHKPSMIKKLLFPEDVHRPILSNYDGETLYQ